MSRFINNIILDSRKSRADELRDKLNRKRIQGSRNFGIILYPN